MLCEPAHGLEWKFLSTVCVGHYSPSVYFPPSHSAETAVWAPCFIYDGKKFAVGLQKSSAQLWDEQIETLRKTNPKVQTLADPGAASEGGRGIRTDAEGRGKKEEEGNLEGRPWWDSNRTNIWCQAWGIWALRKLE